MDRRAQRRAVYEMPIRDDEPISATNPTVGSLLLKAVQDGQHARGEATLRNLRLLSVHAPVVRHPPGGLVGLEMGILLDVSTPIARVWPRPDLPPWVPTPIDEAAVEAACAAVMRGDPLDKI